MLSVAITLLFTLAGFAAMGVVGRSLVRAWRAVGPLRAAIAACDTAEAAMVRTVTVERRVVVHAASRFTPAKRPSLRPTAPCALRVAA